jgi:hypothetical protein
VQRDVLGEAIAHFTERDNALALKRQLVTKQLVTKGRTVRVEKSVVHGLTEEGKVRWFSDYYRTPEYNLPSDQSPS